MRPLDGRTGRVTTIAGIAIAISAGAASAAPAPRPAAGEWIGSNRTEFGVTANHRGIRQFAHRCGPQIVPVAAITIRADGRFSFDKRVSQPDGSRRRFRITGRFTSAYEATGRVVSSRCTATFKAHSQTAPEPEPEPAPVPETELPE